LGFLAHGPPAVARKRRKKTELMSGSDTDDVNVDEKSKINAHFIDF
jgi:hypothetical protein